MRNRGIKEGEEVGRAEENPTEKQQGTKSPCGMG
jgi:hypothetical protein